LFCSPSFVVCLFYSCFHHFLLCFASFIAMLCAKSPYFVCRFSANSQVPSFFCVQKLIWFMFFLGSLWLFLLCMKLVRFSLIYLLLCVWFFLKLLIQCFLLNKKIGEIHKKLSCFLFFFVLFLKFVYVMIVWGIHGWRCKTL
jgi:hypothetical protein